MEFPLQEEPKPVNQENILSVSEISGHIKKNLESSFSYLQIQGEVSNFRKQSSGHLYFSLKDERAQISCVMFKGSAYQLKKLPKDGDQIIINGNLSVYLPRGNYQVIVQKIQFAGLGEKLAQLEFLKKKLHALGYFDSKKKLPIPKYPKKIGLVTSPTGAALQDMLNILKRRSANFHLILNPVNVQGDLAPSEIAKAIEQFNQLQNVDVLIIGRGGGSIEDLWAFNEEIVAHAIFNSTIPIISAVGHEIDHTLSDYVADLRAPTPSAAAELVMKDKESLLEKLQFLKLSFYKNLSNNLASTKQKLLFFKKQPHFCQIDWLLAPYFQKCDDYKLQFKQVLLHHLKEKRLLVDSKKKLLKSLQPCEKIRYQRLKLADFQSQFRSAIKRDLYNKREKLLLYRQNSEQITLQNLHNQRKQWQLKNFFHLITQLSAAQLKTQREKLQSLSVHLKAVNPQNILNKGYHIIFSEKDKQAIISAKHLKSGDMISIQSKDGKSKAEIKESILYEQ
jgi:exodeoxyribonuclease VII large subunit